ncbi:hypothetical protein DWX82_14895 [Odoribacter sp. AF21-41]|nr:hypothetical protein DWX82_14895 [Odoribacter sp. AF21-41]RHH90015.1 hypothetical protein DW186_17535 [Odoribacter sp. AM16-33]
MKNVYQKQNNGKILYFHHAKSRHFLQLKITREHDHIKKQGSERYFLPPRIRQEIIYIQRIDKK